MRYVILRDDDTNALTPVECLERLYRPFLDRGLPVNLAVIPEVSTNAVTPEGKPEGFLFPHEPGNIEHRTSNIEHRTKGQGSRVLPSLGGFGKASEGRGEHSLIELAHCAAELPRALFSPSPPRSGGEGRGEVVPRAHGENSLDPRPSTFEATVPLGTNAALINYLRENPLYHVAQHGCHHDCFEFDRDSRSEITARLDRGMRVLIEAGFPRPITFVAPHDKFSGVSYQEVAERFPVISSGWFEWRRLPVTWWPEYLGKKARGTPHWQVNGTLLLSHPGCLLSAHSDLTRMLDEIIRSIQSRQLTILVTHWWEYFPAGKPNEEFIRVLHQTADYLASQNDIQVISFDDLIKTCVALS